MNDNRMVKILTLMTEEIGAVLKGLYAGQKAKLHPYSTEFIKIFFRQDIALIGHEIGEEWHWTINSLNELCLTILKLLKIPENAYKGLPAGLKRGYKR